MHRNPYADREVAELRRQIAVLKNQQACLMDRVKARLKDTVGTTQAAEAAWDIHDDVVRTFADTHRAFVPHPRTTEESAS